jgi:hypothetical protein
VTFGVQAYLLGAVLKLDLVDLVHDWLYAQERAIQLLRLGEVLDGINDGLQSRGHE